MKLSDLRREYTMAGLHRAELDPNPIAQFHRWFQQALDAGLTEPSAMTLATADAQGRPSARIVLLKAVEERGFVFFTNYESRKGRELAENPHAALVCYWGDLEREVLVAGTVNKSTREESATYFARRPRGSQLGAWVSRQSTVVPDHGFLEGELKAVEERFAGGAVALPDYWGGYILKPSRIEFWQGRPNRLHDRFQYSRPSGGSWRIDRLSP